MILLRDENGRWGGGGVKRCQGAKVPRGKKGLSGVGSWDGGWWMVSYDM